MAQTTLTAPPGIRQSQFIPELNGVRGLAILAVLLFHFGSLYLPPNPTFADRLLMSVFRFGWTGVDLFFVLSGFLITGILIDTREASNYFRAFYARRFLRIFPLYYGVLALIFFLLPALKTMSNHPDLSAFLPAREQIWYWLHFSNWRTAINPQAFLVTNFWTLSVEEQFYLVWPAALAICPKRFYIVLCLLLIALALILRNTPYFIGIQNVHDNFIYRLTPFRLDTLALGALIAVLSRTKEWQRLASRMMWAAAGSGLLLVSIAVAISHKVSPLSLPMIRIGYSGVALICTSILIYAVIGRGEGSFSARILRSTFLMNFGEYSYGIYMFHGIARYYLGFLVSRWSFNNFRSFSLLVISCGIGISYMAAYCSFHIFEQHFLKMKKYFGYTSKSSTVEA